jgi:hypothetical protein
LANETVDFLKADIEGSEHRMLLGASRLMAASQRMRLAVCTYHRENDASDISRLLAEKGFDTSFSHGFIPWVSEHGLTLRRGVVRAIKKAPIRTDQP